MSLQTNKEDQGEENKSAAMSFAAPAMELRAVTYIIRQARYLDTKKRPTVQNNRE